MGWYLNISTQFMKNLSTVWTEKDKIIKWYFAETKQIVQQILKMQ
jgi:hypothetical protein